MTEKQELELLEAMELSDYCIDYTKLKTETLEEIANHSKYSVKSINQFKIDKLSKETIEDMKLNMIKYG